MIWAGGSRYQQSRIATNEQHYVGAAARPFALLHNAKKGAFAPFLPLWSYFPDVTNPYTLATTQSAR